MRVARSSLVFVLGGGALLALLGACGLDWTPDVPGGDGAGGDATSAPTSASVGPASTGAGASSSSSDAASTASSSASTSNGGAGGAGGSSTGGVGGGGGSPPADCDAEASCLACNACAVGAGEPCAALRSVCSANAFCGLLESCINDPNTGCNGDISDYECADYCISVSPLGSSDYIAMMQCAVCATCVNNCASIQNYWCAL